MTDPHVKVLAYSVDASWSSSPSRSSKLHAAADPSNEYSAAACSDRIPLNVDMGGYDPEQVRRELCQKPACQRALFPDTAARAPGKPDRRQPPPVAGVDTATDRRRARRRRRDELAASKHRAEQARRDRGFEATLKNYAFSDLLALWMEQEGLRKMLVANEIDRRVPKEDK